MGQHCPGVDADYACLVWHEGAAGVEMRSLRDIFTFLKQELNPLPHKQMEHWMARTDFLLLCSNARIWTPGGAMNDRTGPLQCVLIQSVNGRVSGTSTPGQSHTSGDAPCQRRCNTLLAPAM